MSQFAVVSFLNLKIASDRSFDAEELEAAQYKRLSADEAQELRAHLPAVTAWQVVGLQAIAGLLVALAAFGLTQRASTAWSAAYGAMTVLIPAALFAWALGRQFSQAIGAQGGMSGGGAGFFVWEAVKIVITLVMLFLASRLVKNLEWLALLAGLVVTLKVYWVALVLKPRFWTRRKAGVKPEAV